MIRLVIALSVATLILLVVLFLKVGNSPFGACAKCKGLGYWEGTRFREQCDECRGSGKARRRPD